SLLLDHAALRWWQGYPTHLHSQKWCRSFSQELRRSCSREVEARWHRSVAFLCIRLRHSMRAVADRDAVGIPTHLVLAPTAFANLCTRTAPSFVGPKHTSSPWSYPLSSGRRSRDPPSRTIRQSPKCLGTICGRGRFAGRLPAGSPAHIPTPRATDRMPIAPD